MRVAIVPRGHNLIRSQGSFVLIKDDWDDWFRWVTMFRLVFVNVAGEALTIGDVKIGQVGLTTEQGSPDRPPAFDSLDQRFFSVGQDDSYYAALSKLGPELEITCSRHSEKSLRMGPYLSRRRWPCWRR